MYEYRAITLSAESVQVVHINTEFVGGNHQLHNWSTVPFLLKPPRGLFLPPKG